MTYSTTLIISLTASFLSGPVPMPPPAKAAQAKPAVAKAVSDAEKVARVQRMLDTSQKELQALQHELKDPASDYCKVLKAFQVMNAELEKHKEQVEKLRKAKDIERLKTLQIQQQELQGRWQHAKERLGLALQERKTMQQKVKVLQEKIQQDEKVLDELTGKEQPAVSQPAVARPNASAVKTPVTPPGAKITTPIGAAVAATSAKPTDKQETANTPGKGDPAKESEELKQAKHVAKQKSAAAAKAKEKAQSITQRIKTLQTNIRLDQQLRQTTRKKLDNCQKALTALEIEQERKFASGAGAKVLQQGWKKIHEERQRVEKTRMEARKISNRLTELQEELSALQREQLLALKEADHKSKEAESAKKKVAELENPFSPNNLLQWALTRGPQVVGIVVCMILLHFLVRILSWRIVSIVSNGPKRKREREAEQRAETLVGVFRNFAALVIWGGGTLMLLETIDIPIVPLMGGAAVLGLAIAFGAQNLIRDYFTGFMILIEDQYAVRDYVAIGTIEGTVEKITMRMTVLRSRDGAAHFIPHGTISTVTNLTHTWSRAFLEIGVAYKEDVDVVMTIIKELGEQLRTDPEFGPMISDDLEMLGVDNFGDSAVVIKCYLKTKPLKQWKVKREMLRRIKKRFDDVGIEIPFPHRTVYHRTDETPARQDDAPSIRSSMVA